MIENTTRIEATLLAHSRHPEKNITLSTFEVVLPYVIWAEVMTARVFSRNAASFRAVPTDVFVQEVIDTPFMPVHWGKNQRGMQAQEEQDSPVVLNGIEYTREAAWLSARDQAVIHAKAFAESGYHKQVTNRLLSPFVHMRAVISSTAWLNFETLRCHEDAEPHIQILARKIRDLRKTTPRILKYGEWHLPYISDEELEEYGLEACKKISAERCARVSYKLRDGTDAKYDPDFRLYKQLIESFPVHASPVEHQATPDSFDPNELNYGRNPWVNHHLHGNFTGFVQNRKTIVGEATMEEWHD